MTDLDDQKLRKRYAVVTRKQGVCSACLHRDAELHHGGAFCRGNFRRQHPTCAGDAQLPRFELDVSVVNELKNRGK